MGSEIPAQVPRAQRLGLCGRVICKPQRLILPEGPTPSVVSAPSDPWPPVLNNKTHMTAHCLHCVSLAGWGEMEEGEQSSGHVKKNINIYPSPITHQAEFTEKSQNTKHDFSGCAVNRKCKDLNPGLKQLILFLSFFCCCCSLSLHFNLRQLAHLLDHF